MMNIGGYHSLSDLFAQLGLPSDEAGIKAFIEQHHALSSDIDLADAPWWTSAQRAFLHEALEEDADWAEAVDELNELLHYH